MALYAAPDFGAGGMVVLILGGLCLAMLAVSAGVVVRGVVLLRRPPPARRRAGVSLVVAGLLLPMCCCSGPSVLFRLHHDSPPLGGVPSGIIQVGMTPDEVRQQLGAPHQINDRHPQRVTWLYWIDAIQLDWFEVTFGPDGKVDGTGRS